MLGLLWTRDELEDVKPRGRPDADVKELHLNLASLLVPELEKGLRNWIKKAKDEKGNPIKELGLLPRDQWLDVIKQALGAKVV